MLMGPHRAPPPACRYRCRKVLVGSRNSNPMYVLICPVTAQYVGEPGDALAVWYLTILIAWPLMLVVLASCAHDMPAGITGRFAMSDESCPESVGTFATLLARARLLAVALGL